MSTRTPEPVTDDPLWEGRVAVDPATFRHVLTATAKIVRERGIRHLFMGGLASSSLGRMRWTHDIDLFVHPDDARRTLEVLAEAGFETREADPAWLYKALKDEVLVDVIFMSDGRVVLDEEMAARAVPETVQGVEVPVIPPEDLVVIKALVHREATGRHWYDALALLDREDLDWDYLLRRAVQYGPARVLSLLYYARSDDISVPPEAIRKLVDVVEEDPG